MAARDASHQWCDDADRIRADRIRARGALQRDPVIMDAGERIHEWLIIIP